jgi:hypothetical protein
VGGIKDRWESGLLTGLVVLGMAILGDGCTGNGDCWEVSEYLGNSLLGSKQNMGKNQFIGE